LRHENVVFSRIFLQLADTWAKMVKLFTTIQITNKLNVAQYCCTLMRKFVLTQTGFLFIRQVILVEWEKYPPCPKNIKRI